MIPFDPGPEPRDPAIWQSRRLWSLWDMLSLNAANFMHLLQTLFTSEMRVLPTTGPLPDAMGEVNKLAARAIREYCDDLHLPVTKGVAEYIEKSRTSEELAAAFLQVKRTMHIELKERRFYSPEPRYSGYFYSAKLFGNEVFASFPSANNDILEAGTCLSLERGTACVMHLMRVMEVGLAALAKTVGVAKQNDWGRYLAVIEGELTARYKTSGARTPDEQFYAEAAATFDRVRRAWRNPTMHVEHNYSPDRAQEILEAVKSFMNHLATKVSE